MQLLRAREELMDKIFCEELFWSNKRASLKERLKEKLLSEKEPYCRYVVVPHEAARYEMQECLKIWNMQASVLVLQDAIEILSSHFEILAPIIASAFEITLKLLHLQKTDSPTQEELAQAYLRAQSYYLQLHLLQDLCSEPGQAIFSQPAVRYFSLDSALREPFVAHFFGFSYLAPAYGLFIHTLSRYVSVSLYLLSPCREFHSEMLSAMEVEKLFKKENYSKEVQMALEGYFAEDNPLLAEYGQSARALLSLFDKTECISFESYQEYKREDCKRAPSALGIAKEALLNNRKGNLSCPQDESIQLLSFPTNYRQIEHVTELICSHVAEGISLTDILVMAPDIAPYVPLLEPMLKEKGLPYSLFDGPLYVEPQWRSLEKLLALDHMRYSASAYRELLASELFAKAANFSCTDLNIIEKYIDEMGVRFGIDEAHLQTLFEGGTISNEGSWWHCFNSFAVDKKTELFERFANHTMNLFRHLHQLTANRNPFAQWVEIVEALCATYLRPLDSKERQFLQKLSALSADKTYDFATFRFFFSKFIREERTNSVHKNAISIGSIATLSGMSGRIIYVLGMNEESFPLSAGAGPLMKSDSTHLLHCNRYALIDLLLAAEEKLIFCYLGYDPVEGEKKPLCPLVSTLSRYLGGIKQMEYPAFVLSKPITGMTVHMSSRVCPSTIAEQVVIDLYDLKTTLHSPLSRFFHKSYGLSLKRDGLRDQDSEFTLDYLQAAKARRQWLQKVNERLPEFVKEGRWPTEVFAKLFIERAKREGELMAARQKQYGPSITVELKKGQPQSVQKSENYWIKPALVWREGEKEIFLVGKIEGIVEGGLFLQNRYSPETAFCHLPHFLAASLTTPFSCFEELIFGRDGRKKKRFFENEALSLLQKIVQLHRLAENSAIYLKGSLLPAILKRDDKAMQEAIQQLIEEGQDIGYCFAYQTLQLPKINQLLEQAWEQGKDFSKVADEWF